MKRVILLIISFIICILISFYLNNKVINVSIDEVIKNTTDMDLSNTIEAFVDHHPRSLYVDDYKNIDSYEDLYNKSDLIVKIRFVERKQKYNIIESKVEVLSIYKGKCDKEIILYEPIVFDGKGYCLSYSTIPLLHENQEYIVFLMKALPYDKEYYNYVNTCLGAYAIKNNINIKALKIIDGNYFDFKDVLQYDAVKLDYDDYVDKNQSKDAIDNYYEHINKYNDYHNKIMKQFNLLNRNGN